MAILKFQDAKKLPMKEIDEKESELKRELMKLKSQIATGTPPENPGRVREIRRTLARIETLKTQQRVNASGKTTGGN